MQQILIAAYTLITYNMELYSHHIKESIQGYKS